MIIKFVWTSDCDRSFESLKGCLVAAPVLNCPHYNLPFVVQCNASEYGLGKVLVHPHLDGVRVISYLSRFLTRQKPNFSTTEKECLAVLWSIEKLRPYLDGVLFAVVTGHYSFVWLHNLKDPTERLARWAVCLQQYDLKVVHRQVKDHVVPDTLSRSVSEIDGILKEVDDSWYRGMLQKVAEEPLKYPQ